MSGRTPRLIAGTAVLVILVILAIALAPPYIANWRLQNYINDLADNPATAKQMPDVVRTQVLNAAAGLGLPVHGDDVHVVTSDGAVKIDVLYIVHVDLAGYTIDLHFRPAAGS